MIAYKVTSAAIGICLGLGIMILVKRDYMHVRHSIWWFIAAVVSCFFGLFPGIVDFIAPLLGVNYPPTLLFSFAGAFLVLKILKMDIDNSKQENEIKRLIQRVSILEKKAIDMTEDGS